MTSETLTVEAGPQSRRRVRRSVVFAAVGVLALAYAVGSILVSAAWGFGNNRLLEFVSGASFLGPGLYAIYRRPANLVGLLVLAFGVLWFLPYWATLFPYYLEATVEVLGLSIAALLVHIVLVFPDGRTTTRFARGVIIGTYIWTLGQSFAREATWDRTEWARDGYDCSVMFCRATFSLWPSLPVYEALGSAGIVATVVIVVLTVFAFGQRWRGSSPVQRRDLQPLWLPIVLVGSCYLAESVGSWLNAGEEFFAVLYEVRMLAQILTPIVIVWGLINARVAASAVGDVVREIRNPLRTDDLENALALGLRDPTIRLLTAPTGDGWMDGAGASATLPDDARRVAFAGSGDRLRVALVHDPGVEPDAAAAAAAVAGLALENATLHEAVTAQLAEVEASRARIVAAGYAERKRVERDLHDGAQQYIVAASMKVGEALMMLDALRAAGDSPQLAAVEGLLVEAQRDTSGALRTLRETVAGVHSRTLAERGLEAAVRELGERLSAPGDPVEVRVPFPLPPLPGGVLSSAWYFASEALTNAAKHAPGAHVSILVVADTALHVSVVDDGPGGAVLTGGHALSGIRERLRTFGGDLTLTSPSGGPTTVVARIPLLLRHGESGVPPRTPGRIEG